MKAVSLLLVGLIGLLLIYGSLVPGAQTAWAALPANAVQQQLSHAIPMYDEAVPVAWGLPACLRRLSQPRCYTPQQIRRAYQIQPLLNAGITGKGQTIVIIDFFQSPTVRRDLQLFDQLFHLPAPRLTIYAPSGLTPFNSKSRSQRLAAIETSLDVEWAHAIAPDAAIALVLSRSEEFEDVYAATRFAIEYHLGNVLSQSFGLPESSLPLEFARLEHELFMQACAQGMSVFASSGDRGTLSPIYGGIPRRIIALGRGVEFPASDPLVTSVSGTSLFLDSNGNYEYESVWSNRTGAPGGGFSHLFARPDYQEGIMGIGSTRGVPDVAYVGDPTTGVLAVTTILTGRPTYLPLGGTSAGSPQWAALTALGNQLAGHPLGFLNPALYQLGRSPRYHSVFHDITRGSNTYIFKVRQLSYIIPGYAATPNWDPATGLGTPIATRLLQALTGHTQLPLPRAAAPIHLNTRPRPRHPLRHTKKPWRSRHKTCYFYG